jgi:TetR/AcrR family transcriptional regulator, mexJK operon transcriptional repressor
MNDAPQVQIAVQKPGRPRRGTEPARNTELMNAATLVFLRDGYGLASIDKVAAEAGMSTRTIYERFKNKADLLGAVINRLLERMSTVLATADLDRLEPRAALTVIAETVTERVREPESAALFRIVATEAHRFPELVAKMREIDQRCVAHAVAGYFRRQIGRGTLVLAEPERAASLFLQMICSEIHESILFDSTDAVTQLDCKSHSNHVIDIFLLGAAPRAETSRSDA